MRVRTTALASRARRAVWALFVPAALSATMVIAGPGAHAQSKPKPPKAAAPKAPASAAAACVEVTSASPYRGYGYDHIVQLKNTCPNAQLCRVKTDANPAEVEQSVPAGEARDVLTFRGSPASAFTPTVSCKEAG